jgi:hypothetical protein
MAMQAVQTKHNYLYNLDQFSMAYYHHLSMYTGIWIPTEDQIFNIVGAGRHSSRWSLNQDQHQAKNLVCSCFRWIQSYNIYIHNYIWYDSMLIYFYTCIILMCCYTHIYSDSKGNNKPCSRWKHIPVLPPITSRGAAAPTSYRRAFAFTAGFSYGFKHER